MMLMQISMLHNTGCPFKHSADGMNHRIFLGKFCFSERLDREYPQFWYKCAQFQHSFRLIHSSRYSMTYEMRIRNLTYRTIKLSMKLCNYVYARRFVQTTTIKKMAISTHVCLPKQLQGLSFAFINHQSNR